jgi:hypothetical protein
MNRSVGRAPALDVLLSSEGWDAAAAQDRSIPQSADPNRRGLLQFAQYFCQKTKLPSVFSWVVVQYAFWRSTPCLQ